MIQKTTPSSPPTGSFDADVKPLPPEDSGQPDPSGSPNSEQAEAFGAPRLDAFAYSNYSEPTKTNRTAAEYVEKASRILRKAQRELGLLSTEGPDLLEAVQHIIGQRIHLTKASWRYYKAALVHYLNTEMNPLDPAVDTAMVELLKTDTDACLNAGEGKGSSKKRKSIPRKDLEKLIEGAASSVRHSSDDKNLAQHAVDWLVAATVTGLRPVEWREATVEHSEQGDHLKRRHKLRFVVQNAKATNGRAHGPTRSFLVSTDEETKNTIFRVYDRTTALNETNFGLYLKNCRQALRRLCKRLWPNAESKNYTLYTGRHQFSANQKSSGKSKKEVSYLMGHKVTKTAVVSYGKKRQGWSSHPDITEVTPDEAGFELRVIDDAKVFRPKTPTATPTAGKTSR